jgi:tetratricopeptide (TPR) repeat protein
MSLQSDGEAARRWFDRQISGSTTVLAIIGALVAAVAITLMWTQPQPSDGADPSIVLSGMLESAQKLHQEGRHDDACSVADRAVRLAQANFGDDHPATAHVMNELAVMLIDAGRFTGVEEMLRKVSAIHSRVYGPVSPDVAVVIHNLAVLSERMGDLSEAEDRYVRAIEMYAQLAEPDPGMAQSFNNLAGIADLRGDYPTAERLHRRALEVREALFGYAHVTTAESIANLASILLKRGDLPTSERLYRRALAIREHALGPTHVATASSMNGLALAMLQRDDVDGAEPMAVGALAIRERMFGNQHPSTASSLETVATVCQRRGEPVAARKLLDRALAIRMEKNGPNHPKTADTLMMLGEFFATVVGEHEPAAAAFGSAAAIRLAALGDTNQQTVWALEKQCEELRKSDHIAESGMIEKKLAELRSEANLPAAVTELVPTNR